jgi:hypothetical protein
VEFTFNASLRCFAPSTPILLLPACHSEHDQRLTSLLLRRYILSRSSCWRVEFTFNASLRCFAPSSPILLPACHNEHGQRLILLLIRRYIHLKSSCWRVPFTFNASLRCFAPSSPMLFTACRSEHGQRLTSLLIVDTYPAVPVAGAWSSLSMLRSGALLHHLQCDYLHEQ